MLRVVLLYSLRSLSAFHVYGVLAVGYALGVHLMWRYDLAAAGQLAHPAAPSPRFTLPDETSPMYLSFGGSLFYYLFRVVALLIGHFSWHLAPSFVALVLWACLFQFFRTYTKVCYEKRYWKAAPLPSTDQCAQCRRALVLSQQRKDKPRNLRTDIMLDHEMTDALRERVREQRREEHQARTLWVHASLHRRQERELRRQQLDMSANAAQFLYIVGSGLLLIGTVIISVWLSRLRLLVLTAIACGYDYVLYYIFPFRALQSGLGEALSAFSYGVVFPVVAFYIVTGELTTFPLASALPLAILGYAFEVINSLKKHRVHKVNFISSFSVRHSEAAGRLLVVVLSGVAVQLLAFVSPTLPATALAATCLPALALIGSAMCYARSSDSTTHPLRARKFAAVSTTASTVALCMWAFLVVCDVSAQRIAFRYRE